MNYKFRCDTNAVDLWKLTMYNTYHSLAGTCNVVFTVAMMIVTIALWNKAGDAVLILLMVGCVLFPVFQPIGIYIKARQQVSALPSNMEIAFDHAGVHVKTETEHSDLKWNQIKSIRKVPNMLIIFSSNTHGFMLTNRALGNQKDALFDEISAIIRQK